MYHSIRAIKNAIYTTCNTNYPLNIKIERLRALQLVCENLRDSIQNIKHWDELKLIFDDIVKTIDEYQILMPKGMVVYY